MPSQVEPYAIDTPLGTISVGADLAYSRPSDDAESLFHDLMVYGASLGTPGHTALGGAVTAPGYPCAMGPGVAGLVLLGSPDSPSPPINWVGGGQCGTCMFASHNRGKAAVRNTGRSQLGYHASNSG
jgi:hypothetical protein